MKQSSRILAAAVAATMISFTPLGAADARVDPSPSTFAESALTSNTPVLVKKGPDRLCRKARRIDKNPGRCQRSVTRKSGKAKRVNARTLEQMGDLRSPISGITMREAAEEIPAPIYCKTWSEWMRGLYYVNWKEVHKGKFCFNGNDVWVSESSGGWHKCDLGYGFGYDIAVKDCSENILYVDTEPGYGYQNWDRFRVHIAWKGIPLWATHEMHANVYPSGNAYFY